MAKTFYILLAVTLAAAAAFAGQKVVGARGTAIDEPFCAGCGTAYRVQVLVLKGQLGFAAPITRLEYQSAAAASDVKFYKLELRLCRTSRAVLTDDFAANYENNTPALVAKADPYNVNVKLDEWFGFDLSPPFNYDNSKNLIVEVRWQNEATGAKANTWAYDTGVGRMLKTREYSGPKGTLVGTVNRFRVTYDNPAVDPSSLGRVKALYR